jgi:ABC-type polysaccharide/polyol phosphate export permease
VNWPQQFGLVCTRSIGYVSGILRNRSLILQLTYREFRARHLGSALGLIWSFVHPGVMMAIYCLVFTYALKPTPIAGAPFLVWILAGLVPWFLVSDCIASGSSVIMDNRFLVKKVVFRVSLLPVVRLLTNLPVHAFLLVVIMGIFWKLGYPPTIYTLQIFYYLAALMVLALGWTLLTSALVPFLKDLGQVVAVILQIAFWVTPLIWNTENIDHSNKTVMTLVNLNPATYIVQGYRESMVYHQVFWHHPLIGAYYWGVSLTILVIGGAVFAKLQRHFADVL